MKTTPTKTIENPQRKTPYAHGYASEQARLMHGGRTAQVHGAFFLPHLHAGMKLLDCGCGSGSITVGLAEIVGPGQVVGIDVATSELARARTSAQERAITNVGFEQGNVFELAFADATFDAVFCHNVLEHLDDPQSALREMQRVLKPGGVIGLRDCDMGGKLIYPIHHLVDEWFALYEADWCAVAGDSRFGRRLPGLVRKQGFHPLKVTASFDTYGDRESVRLISRIGASRCAEPDFAQRVLASGLVTAQQLAAMRAAWLAWAEEADAFAAIAHTEVVGWKV